MKIGVDISMLVYRGSGVATYTYNFVKNLLKYDKENEYRLFYSSLRRPQNFYYLKEFRKLGAKVYDYPFPPRVLKLWWNRYHLLPVERFIGKVDVYHSSDFLRPPLSKETKAITTIHDLTWKLYPGWHTSAIVRAHEEKMRKTIKYGDTIIVPSRSTKKDLLKLYPEVKKSNKVYVVYEGIDERFKPLKDRRQIESVLKKYEIEYPARYLLYVGAIEPRKNLDTAIKVFSKLIKNKKYSDFKFLIVGRAGWKNEDVFKLVKDLNLRKKVHFVGFVDDKDLPYFYNAAQVFIYLSKHEGFGLPPLEALACGTKTLAAKNSSLEEIIEEKFLVGLSNQEPIKESLVELIDSPAKVDSILYKKRFNWSQVAKKALSIFEALANG